MTIHYKYVTDCYNRENIHCKQAIASFAWRAQLKCVQNAAQLK